MNRRSFLSGVSSAAVMGAGGMSLFPYAAHAATATNANTPSAFKQEFSAAAANNPYLTPYRGAASDLYCESLAIEGAWPEALRGRFYRTGPANFERGNERYQHWFDGDGMVQQFTFDGKRVSHRGRYVQTTKYKAEREANAFLVPAFGTGVNAKLRITGPDSMNTANTNAIEHAGRVFAMWEGGSAFEMDRDTLETKGAVTWQAGWEQMPFSAHPKVDPQGNLWNIGSSGSSIFVYHVDPRGKLVKTQTAKLAIDRKTHGGMMHDMTVTERFIIVPIPAITIRFDQLTDGKTMSEVAKTHASAPLKMWVAPKDDISKAQIFDLPPEMVFHVGNAYERAGTNGPEIVMQYIGSANNDFLFSAAVSIMRGKLEASGESIMKTAVMNLATGKANVETFDRVQEEFPRIDPRFIGVRAKQLVTPVTWRHRDTVSTGFHAIQVRDVDSGKTQRFDYGDDFIVEEHLVIARPGSTREFDGWVIGTAFNAKKQNTCVSVFRADKISDGPIARAYLPYWLPLGFHGNFTHA